MLHLIYTLAFFCTEGPFIHGPLAEAATVFGTVADTVKNPQSAAAAIDAARENVLRPGEQVADKIRKNLFVRVSANKTTCYVGEPIVAEYKLYSRLVAKSKIVKQPSLNGFTAYEMIDVVPLAESVETFQGRRYKVHTLKKTQLIPLQTGTLELDPLELENRVEFIKSKDLEPRKGDQLGDLLDSFLDEETAPSVTHSASTQSAPVVLSVKPLPDNNRPAHFNGAVGQFTIRASIDSQQVTAGNAALLTIEISGKGNLALIEPPVIQWPGGFESMDVRSSEELNKTLVPLRGTKRFEYVFIAGKEGRYDIPAVQFAYFDPAGEEYKSTSTPPVLVRVSPGQGVSHSSEPAPRASENPGLARFLKTHLGWLLILLLALIGILFMWMRTLHRGVKKPEPKPHVKPRSTSPLTPTAEHPLQRTRMLLASADPHGFYTELNKALLKILSEKLKRSPGELYKPYIVSQLQGKGWTEPMIADLVFLLRECEKNLYSSNDIPGTDMAGTLHMAERVVADLQKW